MWAAHDELTWHDCQPDDALPAPHTAICTSANGNTWLGTLAHYTHELEDAPVREPRESEARGEERGAPHPTGAAGEAAGGMSYVLDRVELSLMRARLVYTLHYTLYSQYSPYSLNPLYSQSLIHSFLIA